MSSRGSTRKALPLPVPVKGEDAAERKRVLNVLAQRRYRQRKREHVRKLEAQAGVSVPNEDLEAARHAKHNRFSGETYEQLPVAENESFAPIETVRPAELQKPDPEPMPPDLVEDFTGFDQAFMTNLSQDWGSLLPSLPGSPISSAEVSDNQTQSLTSISSPKTSSSSSTPWTFPDEEHLLLPETSLIRGSMIIATRLNVHHKVWIPDALSPYNDPSMAYASFDHLPPNLRPTMMQIIKPHHPMFDLLPWPRMREKMTLAFSQPIELRPPAAQSPMALYELVYDIEDSAEGMRITGQDPCSEKSWEVGEKIFQNWWWALDRDIIRRSNELRRMRGAPPLGAGMVLGEIG